jgi:undecaprenyl-diphosphatase
MPTILEAILLGIIQGLTEWLPISSSAHLVITQQLLKIKVPLLFDVMLHFGTLIAVIVLFWDKILKIIKSFLKFDFKSEEGRLGLLIIIGSIPVGITGFLLHDYIEYFFNNLFLVGFSLIITGTLLYFTKNKNGKNRLNFSDSLLIGFTQAISLVPGISRSGSTISMGLLRILIKKRFLNFFSYYQYLQ